MQQTGIVKWFNNAKGYGFILPDDGGSDIFAHYSSIEMEGYKTLKAGQLVAFDTIPGPKGLHAANIQALDKPKQKSTDGDEDSTSASDLTPENTMGSDQVMETSS